MIMHPEVLEKVQAEMDSVIGPDRLPDFDDRNTLPYLESVMKELYRQVRRQIPLLDVDLLYLSWTCPLPLGLCS